MNDSRIYLISTRTENDATSDEILWTNDEVADLIEELAEEKNKAIDEAVKIATIDCIAENIALKEAKNQSFIYEIGTLILTAAISFLVGYLIGS